MSPKSSSLFFHNCCISHAVVIFKKCTQYICSQSGNRRQYFQPIRKQEAISAANQETGGYICSQSGNRGDICSQSRNRRRYLQPIRIQEAIFEANYRKQEVLRLVGHADQEFKILIAYGEILGGLINCGSYCTCCLMVHTCGWMVHICCWMVHTCGWMVHTCCWMVHTCCWMVQTCCWMVHTCCCMVHTCCWMVHSCCWMVYTCCWMVHTCCWMVCTIGLVQIASSSSVGRLKIIRKNTKNKCYTLYIIEKANKFYSIYRIVVVAGTVGSHSVGTACCHHGRGYGCRVQLNTKNNRYCTISQDFWTLEIMIIILRETLL